MLVRAITSFLLVTSAAACGTTQSGIAPREPAGVATAARPAVTSCAARSVSPLGDGTFTYAYGALSNEMQRLREPGGRASFNVRRVLDRIADAVDSLPEQQGVGTKDAAFKVRSQVTRLIESSPSQGERAQATRRALEEAHGVLRRLADGPCRGDAALRHRVEQLGEAVDAIPNDPALQRVSLVPILTALQRAQGAFLALSTSDKRRLRAEPSAGMAVAAISADGRALE